MIQYNLTRIILLRGHSKPADFLQQNGFSYQKSHRMLAGQVQITFKELFFLCKLLRCTPNDLMELVPDSKHPLEADHPLQALQRSMIPEESLQTLLKTIPADKLDQARELLSSINREQ